MYQRKNTGKKRQSVGQPGCRSLSILVICCKFDPRNSSKRETCKFLSCIFKFASCVVSLLWYWYKILMDYCLAEPNVCRYCWTTEVNCCFLQCIGVYMYTVSHFPYEHKNIASLSLLLPWYCKNKTKKEDGRSLCVQFKL